ncbi:hypothetical protein BCR42DRAFT_423389 [Absidia repens]|uniref:Alpha/beta hydrolase fold-3 domain-containing protein n=1 Tax=Absidia repens TaxID=90262 RepID=A0A1X2I5S8_9FUNG|nr:hypothetical protein BCR42DRAFT_423389 [Absidia repens]
MSLVYIYILSPRQLLHSILSTKLKVANQGGMSMASISLKDMRQFSDNRYSSLPSEMSHEPQGGACGRKDHCNPWRVMAQRTVQLVIMKPNENEISSRGCLLVGMVVGRFLEVGTNTTEKFMKDVVVRARSVVVYREYTLSPEVRYPVEILFIYFVDPSNIASLNVGPLKLTVFGDSAGENMTAVTSILLKQCGHNDVVHGPVLVYPPTAPTRHHYAPFKIYTTVEYTLSLADIECINRLYFGDKYNNK